MPRPPRLHEPEGVYHIVTRGDNREPIFAGDVDHQEYLRLFSELKVEFSFICYGYALMTNHVHLLLQPGMQTTVSVIMQRLSASYTRYFNWRHKRVGHLYQGRFHSTLINREAYLLEAVRYVHLNPMRAGMEDCLGSYRWTSYQAYMDPTKDLLKLIDPQQVLGMLCVKDEAAREAFKAFLREGVNQPHEGSLDLLFRPTPIKFPKRCQTLRGH